MQTLSLEKSVLSIADKHHIGVKGWKVKNIKRFYSAMVADGFNAMQREIGRAQGVFLRLIADP